MTLLSTCIKTDKFNDFNTVPDDVFNKRTENNDLKVFTVVTCPKPLKQLDVWQHLYTVLMPHLGSALTTVERKQ